MGSVARSWQNDHVQMTMSRKDARTVVGDMCAFRMTVEGDSETRKSGRRAEFMTNAPRVVDRLARTCSKDHKHAWLGGSNRARRVEVYPGEFCKQMIGGLTACMNEHGRWTKPMSACAIDQEWCEEDEDEDCGGGHDEYWDGLSGKKFGAGMVRKAREEEVVADTTCSTCPLRVLTCTSGERSVALIQLTRISPARPVSASLTYMGASGSRHLPRPVPLSLSAPTLRKAPTGLAAGARTAVIQVIQFSRGGSPRFCAFAFFHSLLM